MKIARMTRRYGYPELENFSLEIPLCLPENLSYPTRFNGPAGYPVRITRFNP